MREFHGTGPCRRAAPHIAAALLITLSTGLGVPLFLAKPTAGEYLYAALLVLHIAAGLALAVFARGGRSASGKTASFLLLRAPEVLLSIGVVLFLFSYIYATNANMDYVQRFAASHGNLRLAPNSAQERLSACLRFLPLLVLDASWYVYFRLRAPARARRALAAGAPGGTRRIRIWALPLCLFSGVLFALSFPSFARTAGMPFLAYFCLVPLLLVLSEAPLGWGVFYGTAAGVLQAMIANFWLGTFNLLTLQFVVVITALQYAPFMLASILLFRLARGAGFFVFPAAWTIFDWLRSLGFLGYPWGMIGASQYPVIPLIQVSSLTGVWGVTFLVTLCNAVLAWYAAGAIARKRCGKGAAIAFLVTLGAALGWGGYRTHAAAAGEPTEGARLALIQQNADPRKDDYRAVFDTLRRLTDAALAARPDLVVWSETAFVPNIRRWSAEDPQTNELAALVRDFLAYQRSIGTWLVTGNDDYRFSVEDGVEQRLDFNGAVLFSPSGERVETYHKIHLVPFTESFPFRRQLPGIWDLLMSFDAYLWEPGDRRVVFRHPRLDFSTPICFEDAFPDDVRRFVLAGADAIVNLSNDYWSLTEVEAMQHAANAVFRAVENGRPLARASASGLTCAVDPLGRITARSPLFAQSFLIVDLKTPWPGRTLYTLWGDWFPPALAAALVLVLAAGFVASRSAGRPRLPVRGQPS